MEGLGIYFGIWANASDCRYNRFKGVDRGWSCVGLQGFKAAVCCVHPLQEDIISIWNKTASDQATTARIRDTLRRVLNLPPNTIMEYKTHTDSIKYVCLPIQFLLFDLCICLFT